MSEILLQQILSELKDVKSGQRVVEKCFDKMQGQLEGMQGQLDRIESKQDAIFEQTGQLTEFRHETLTKFDEVVTKEDMHYFEAKMMEHDRDLFNLKKRA